LINDVIFNVRHVRKDPSDHANDDVDGHHAAADRGRGDRYGGGARAARGAA
jgi:hypothetical protein